MVDEQIREFRRQLYLQKSTAYRCAKALESGDLREIQPGTLELFSDFRDLLVGLKDGTSTALRNVVRVSQVENLIATIDMLLNGNSPSPEEVRELRDKLQQFRDDRRDQLNKH
jgi:hypothetical protein